MLTIKQLRRMSLVTLLAFIFSVFAGYSTPVSASLLSLPTTDASSATTVTVSADLSALSSAIPQLASLQSTIKSAETTARSLETVATPIYNTIVPTNMETMSIVERCKAIINNAKNVLSDTLKSSTNNANEKVAQGATVLSLETDEKLALGIQELGNQAKKLDNVANNSAGMQKVKAILASTKATLGKVVTNVREKIFKVGQKVGLIDENKTFENGKVVDKSEASGSKQNSEIAAAGYANSGSKVSFADKFSSGLKEGVENAKTSIKNSFSVQNLAITTAVSVGTSLAVDAINGETPSLKKAVKQVASLEFAGNVVGSALGAAGGQVVGTLVKTFVPGIAGSLIGSVIPVMFSSAGGQFTSNLVSGIKNGEFSVSKAFAQIDKADLVGSSIGSTIGMTLGSFIPVPVVGPIVGGIVGGFLGSKVATWVSGLFGKKKSNNNVISNKINTNYDNGVTIGNISSEKPEVSVACAPVLSVDSKSTSKDKSKNKKLKELQDKYYKIYKEYNRLLESNDIEGSRQVFEELKSVSEEFAKLRNK